MTSLIKLEHISKHYSMGGETVKALDDISLIINEGEFTAIVGASGSGKSTCMNLLGCLDTPSLGSYYLNDQDVSNLSDNKLADIRNKMIGFIFQHYCLLPKLSAIENVELPMMYAGVEPSERKARALQALKKMGIEDKAVHLPSQLSGGQQQRVSIARAICNNPKLILADEPTGALDSKTGLEVMQLLSELNSEGNTVVLITHNPLLAKKAKRIVTLSDGKITSDVLCEEDKGEKE